MTAAFRETRVGAGKQRDQFIPVRKADVLDALVDRGTFGARDEREEFHQVCRMLAAIYHYEYFDELEKLRHAYFYFNPELDPRISANAQTLESRYGELIETFTAVLRGANFIEMTHAEVEQAHRERKRTRVNLEAPSTTSGKSAFSAAVTIPKRWRSRIGMGCASARSRPWSMTTSCCWWR